MKQTTFILAVIFTFFLLSCNQTGSSDEKQNVNQTDISGAWKLVKFEKEGEGPIELKPCDINAVWNFTSEPEEALADGTEVSKFEVIAPEDNECKFFNVESKWTELDGQVFISSTLIGGLGGVSLAGLFDIMDSGNDMLILKHTKYTLTFNR